MTLPQTLALGQGVGVLGLAAGDVDGDEPDLVAVVDDVGAGQQHRQHDDELAVLHRNPRRH